MLTIDLGTDHVETISDTEVVFTQREMSAEQAQQKLNAARAHFEQVGSIMHESKQTVILHSKQGVSLLVEIEEELGLDKLGYKSMRKLIEAELKPYLGLSTSQIYRLYSAAKTRHKCNQMQIFEDCEDIPDDQLVPLNKLPVEQWAEAWKEVVDTTPDKITAKHVRKVIERRVQTQKTISNSSKTQLLNSSSESESYSSNGFKQNETSNIIETEDSQPFQLQENRIMPSDFLDMSRSEDAGASSLVHCNRTNRIKIATIQCNDSSTYQQPQYCNCWGIVQNFLQFSAIVAVQGQLVEYPFQDLNIVENLSPVVGEVCELVTLLWQFPDLPASVKHLLATFYQQRLDFSQGDLHVLKAIEKLSKEYGRVRTPELQPGDETRLNKF